MRQSRILVVLASVLVTGQLAAQTPTLVDVGGYRLEAVVAGEGLPVVVFEAGLGQDRRHWTTIHASVSRFTTVVAYSRAGYGASEASPQPRTPLQIASELRALLRALDLPSPYVLVGHSLGGLYSRVFASQYAAEVAGLVLVDATHERADKEHSVLAPTFWQDVRTLYEAYADSVGGGAPGEMEEWWKIARRGTLPEAWPLPDVPMVVLTAIRVDTSWAGGSEVGMRMWRRMHGEFFAQTTRGAHIVTTASGHNIHEDQPGLVVESIRRIVDMIR